MEEIFKQIMENQYYEFFAWIIGAIASLIGIYKFFFKKNKNSIQPLIDTSNNQTNSNEVNINIDTNKSKQEKISPLQTKYNSTPEAQSNIKILFIDDDVKFKVVNILKTAGWIHTKIVKDINSLDTDDVKKTNIFFVDIQGVGKKLSFHDEGLGLANALKNKYNDKKVVIYSAETRGDRFHDGLRKADDFLSKNADPYEFQQIIENYFVKD